MVPAFTLMQGTAYSIIPTSTRTMFSTMALKVPRGDRPGGSPVVPRVQGGVVGGRPQWSLRNSVLDTLFRMNDDCAPAELGRHYGPRGLAAEPWPRTV